MSESFLDMRGVSTKIFLAREPSLEASSHTYSTMDPVDGFITFQVHSDTRWHKLSVRLSGKLRKILQLCSVIYTEVCRGIQEVVLRRDVAHSGLQCRIKSAIKFQVPEHRDCLGRRASYRKRSIFGRSAL